MIKPDYSNIMTIKNVDNLEDCSSVGVCTSLWIVFVKSLQTGVDVSKHGLFKNYRQKVETVHLHFICNDTFGKNMHGHKCLPFTQHQ